MRSERGFSLIELLTVTAVIGALSGIAMINSRELRERGYDAVAVSDYRNVKTVILGERLRNPDADSNYVILARNGPGPLPAPLQTAQLSNNVQLTLALKISLAGLDIILFQLMHVNGRYMYRYIDINGTITEQRILTT